VCVGVVVVLLFGAPKDQTFVENIVWGYHGFVPATKNLKLGTCCTRGASLYGIDVWCYETQHLPQCNDLGLAAAITRHHCVVVSPVVLSCRRGEE